MPAKDQETSTHRLEGLGTWRMKALGRLVTSAYTGGKLQGRALIKARDVQGLNGLWLKADRLSVHVGIRGWPPPKPKAHQKYVAGLVAQRATLQLY